jgi:hypothetical protein
MENFLKILTYGQWVILDSYSFCPVPLANLTDTLAKQTKAKNEILNYVPQCKNISYTDNHFDSEKYHLSTVKLCFPYSMATSLEALESPKIFPPISKF